MITYEGVLEVMHRHCPLYQALGECSNCERRAEAVVSYASHLELERELTDEKETR